MVKHISETVVSVSVANQIAETLCGSLRDCALSIDINGTDQVLNFGDGQAIIKPNVCGLYLRVEAEDLATFFGIRSLLQVALSRASNNRPAPLEWHAAGGEPFGAMDNRAGTGGC